MGGDFLGPTYLSHLTDPSRKVAAMGNPSARSWNTEPFFKCVEILRRSYMCSCVSIGTMMPQPGFDTLGTYWVQLRTLRKYSACLFERCICCCCPLPPPDLPLLSFQNELPPLGSLPATFSWCRCCGHQRLVGSCVLCRGCKHAVHRLVNQQGRAMP